jgi:exopolysaccharide biosynthesis polyprenyl glycosylphosphotransferase
VVNSDLAETLVTPIVIGRNERVVERPFSWQIATTPATSTGASGHREPFPLMLHRNARSSARTHAERNVRRIIALLAFDGLVLLAFWTIARAVRDIAVLGADIARIAGLLVPAEALAVAPTVSAVVLGLILFGNYGAGDHRRNPQAIFAGAALGLGLVWWARLWAEPSLWAFSGFGLAVLLLGAALVLQRAVVDTVVRRVRPVGGNAARTLVVGSAAAARQAAKTAALTDTAECIYVGFLDTAPRAAPDALGTVGALISVIQSQQIDTIVLTDSVTEPVAQQILEVADAACCEVLRIPHVTSGDDCAPRLVWRHGLPMLELTRPGSRRQQLLLKRVADLIVASVALLVLAPVFAVIALAIKVTSPGPVLFRQERVGIGGRRFQILKFRTMVQDAEYALPGLATRSLYADGRLFKIPDDPRVTRLGQVLRKASLDELPQLWNVVRGDMSLVGPRPPIPAEVELYDEHHFQRFVMRPGITGPWQVSGRNNVTDFEEVIRLETAYMRNWTLRKDLTIMLRTVPVVLKMEGAH